MKFSTIPIAATLCAQTFAFGTECASVAEQAALTVFETSAKQTPNSLQFIKATTKPIPLTAKPMGRYSFYAYKVTVFYKNSYGYEGDFFYTVETRGTQIKNEKCFIEAVAYNHED